MAAKTTGIASYFEDFCRYGSREGGLKLRCIKCEVIFARTLTPLSKKTIKWYAEIQKSEHTTHGNEK
ncbi:MAG: hypothetical protein GY699_24365 [Desulfobacteraceae bacterium]|nr:hypothetical protein [Desulfobacteraceae bacterium]